MNIPSFADPPFACPPDTVIDIPVPPSVNETRRIDRAAQGKVNKWLKAADGIIVASGQWKRAQEVRGRYEVTVILNEDKCNADPDNVLKAAIDYLRRLELIEDDSPKFARRIVVEWGDAPEGCRLVLKGAA